MMIEFDLMILYYYHNIDFKIIYLFLIFIMHNKKKIIKTNLIAIALFFVLFFFQ